jgi:Fe-S cluster biosynthesis and repair protein YggX
MSDPETQDTSDTTETPNTLNTPETSDPPNTPRMVQCVKLGRELPGLDRPPVPGELGQRIYENISQQAWQMWQEHSRLLINHYGLNLADPDARVIMRQQMEEFFFAADAPKPEGWVPEGQGGAKGKGAPEPAAQRKK